MHVLGIATRKQRRAPMEEQDSVFVSVDKGIESDFNRRPGKRQITLLSVQQWELACQHVAVNLPWTIRRANLLIDGITFDKSMVGRHLQLGDVILEVCVETEPCELMDQQCEGLRAALTPDWRGGICCKVIRGGEIRQGQSLTFV